MSRYNEDIVADLQCRFSEGETPTWEEFYDWIEDILDGFNEHTHDGVTSGDGAKIVATSIDGIDEYEDVRDNTGASAIVLALKALSDAYDAHILDDAAHHARYTDSEVETVIDTELETLGSIETVIYDSIVYHAGLPGAHHTRYADSEVEAVIDTELETLGSIETVIYNSIQYHDGLVGAHAGVGGLASRIADIEGDYVVEDDLDDYYTVTEINSILLDLEGWVDFYYATKVALGTLDGRVEDIEADYLVALDLSTHAIAVTAVHGVGAYNVASTDDIDGLDDRIQDIEDDYVVASDLLDYWTFGDQDDFVDWAKDRWD